MIRSAQALKALFETDDRPTEQDFADLIDSIFAVRYCKAWYASSPSIGNNQPLIAAPTLIEGDADLFDAANHRFRIPAGKAGKYRLICQMTLADAQAIDTNRDISLIAYKNSEIANNMLGFARDGIDPTTWAGRVVTLEAPVVQLAEGDFIIVVFNSDDTGTTTTYTFGIHPAITFFELIWLGP